MKKNLNRIIKLVGLDEMRILPGHLAFYNSFVGLLANFYSVDITKVLSKNIPLRALTMFNDVSNPNPYNLIIFLILSLWLASKGCQAIVISSNFLYKIKDKDIINLKIKSFLMVIILFILISFVFLVPLLGDILIKILKLNNLVSIKNILYYPISIVLMFFLIKSIYFIAPSKKIPSKCLNKGTIFTTITWLFLSRVYSYYLNNFNNYDLYYGSLSNLLILLLWVYLLAYLFTMGMSLNANDYFISKLEIDKRNII